MLGKAPGIFKWVVLATAVTSLGLAGCSSNAPVATSTTATSQSVSPAVETDFRQTRQALESGEFVNARAYLQQLDFRQLSTSQQIEWLLLATETERRSGQLDSADALLQQLQGYRDQASDDQDTRISLAQAQLYQLQGNYFAAARIRVFIAPVLPPRYQMDNHEAIWENLTQMPYEDIDNLMSANAGTDLGTWLQLAELARRPDLTLEDQISALKQWQQDNALHPAAQNLPGNLAYLNELAAQRPQRVAVLLPLSGPLAKSGEAIRDGLMAGYYDALKRNQPTPDLVVIDSQQDASIDELYAQALLAGAQWVIGPVSKQEVQALEQRAMLSLPTLALNYGDLVPTDHLGEAAGLDQPQPPANLFQFGLAPEDEAIQIADRAWQDGHRRALVMVPAGSWGERIFEAFRDHWEAQGGEISEIRFYKNENDYNPAISQLMNVDESNQRYKTMRQLLRQRTEFEPRRRQDADWLFLVAQPQQARLIKPAMAFNFAGSLPVYATSHVYSGQTDKRHDVDLNGISFCDLPWVLEKGALYQQVEQNAERGQGPYVRLYALGLDAYRLLPRLPQLQAFPQHQVGGMTGQLTLDGFRRVHRQTECARFRGGQPQLLGQQ